jgi:hypothetical protein
MTTAAPAIPKLPSQVNPWCVCCCKYAMWAEDTDRCTGYGGAVRPGCFEEIESAGGGVNADTGAMLDTPCSCVSPRATADEAEEPPCPLSPGGPGPSVVPAPCFDPMRHRTAV